MNGLKILNIFQLSELLGLSCASIRSHLQRRNFQAVPKPIRFSRRLGWPIQVVEEWLRKRIEDDAAE